jgi:hypothetical protein
MVAVEADAGQEMPIVTGIGPRTTAPGAGIDDI